MSESAGTTPELQWRIRCADDCGFVVTCADEGQARNLATCENTHGKTLVEARTVTYGEWLPGTMLSPVDVSWGDDDET